MQCLAKLNYGLDIEEKTKEYICIKHALGENITKGIMVVFFPTSNRHLYF